MPPWASRNDTVGTTNSCEQLAAHFSDLHDHRVVPGGHNLAQGNPVAVIDAVVALNN